MGFSAVSCRQGYPSVSSDIGRVKAEPSERGSGLCLNGAGVLKVPSKSWRDRVGFHPSCLCPQ